MKKKSILSQISTKPSIDAVRWAGKERSLLASILLWALWACRVVSLLQISKLIFRKIVSRIKKATVDKNSTRVNVPPMFCELYFILWFASLLCVYLFDVKNTVVNGFVTYYLFESVVWVLYYTVFRRFFEENYSIYHELEYLTVLILIIPTQALGFATLYGMGFCDIIAGILGAGGDLTPFPVKILGALFGAIVISMIISAFPSERVKKDYNKTKAVVIGGGDVVEDKLFPAIGNAEHPFGHIKILDLVSHEKKLPYVTYLEDEASILQCLSNTVDGHTTVWVETPTNSHVSYLRALLTTRAALIVVEKPICTSSEDLEFIEKNVSVAENRERIFFLSYYALEKALTLNMLSSSNDAYRKYLDIEDEYLTKNWRMFLGRLVSAEVVIHEGSDSREWVNDEAGGHLFETFLHNVLIASFFCGRCTDWENPTLTETKDGEVTSIELTASCAKTDIWLSQKKGLSASMCKRYAKFVFTDGMIEADLEKQSATLHFEKINRSVTVCVKEKYKQKYAVMTDLVSRVYRGEISSECDGLQNQLQSIRWLLELQSKVRSPEYSLK